MNSLFTESHLLMCPLSKSECVHTVTTLLTRHALVGAVRPHCFLLYHNKYRVEQVASIARGRIYDDGHVQLFFSLHPITLCAFRTSIACIACICACAIVSNWRCGTFALLALAIMSIALTSLTRLLFYLSSRALLSLILQSIHGHILQRETPHPTTIHSV